MQSTTNTVPHMLLHLGIPAQRLGYKALSVAISHYSQGGIQSFSKELYPYVSAQIPGTSPATVESAVRRCIASAWTSRDPAIWDTYFPHTPKAPSNAAFIATLAEFLKE